MSIRLKNRLLGVLVIVFAMCLAFSAMALVLTGARAEESSVTRDTLPNQIGQDVYSAEFGAQGERGWTYWHKGNKPEDEWVQFASSEYDAESRQYAQGSVMLGHLSAVPSAGASLKRTYTPENDGIVRFMTVLFAYNADGGSGDVNYDVNCLPSRSRASARRCIRQRSVRPRTMRNSMKNLPRAK